MSLSNDQLLDRITALEEQITIIQTALNNVIVRKQVNQLIALKQQEIDSLKDRVTALESQIAILQAAG